MFSLDGKCKTKILTFDKIGQKNAKNLYYN